MLSQSYYVRPMQAVDNPWPLCILQDDRPVAPWSDNFCAPHFPHPADRQWQTLGGFAVLDGATARYVWAALQLRIQYLTGRQARRFPGDAPPPRPRPSGSTSSLFDKVKAAVSVEQLASKYTDLRPAGANRLKGLCPLHKERTPSFYVFTDKGTWRCFGQCAMGGDVITLQQELMDRGL